MSTPLRLLLVAAVLLIAANSQAQFAEAIEVSLANVDVVVLDKQGNAVRGLTRGDFEIYEDGKKQEITNFAAYSSEATRVVPGTVSAGPAQAAVAAPPSRARLFSVFIDISDIDRNDRQRFFQSLRSFLRAQWRPGDLVSLLLWTSRIRELVPITADLADADVALEKLEGIRLQADWQVLEQMAADRIAERAIDATMDRATVDVEAEREYDERLLMELRCTRVTRKIESLSRLVASLAAHELKKVLIVASDDLTLRPAHSCLLRQEMEEVAKTANAHQVTIHAFHPPGVRQRTSTVQVRGLPAPSAPAPGAREAPRTFDETEGLDLIAARTGGIFAVGTPDIVQVLPDVAERLSNYYSLAYRMAPGKTDTARSIRVVTKNRSYKVHARQSVVLLSEDSRLRDAMIANAYAAVPAAGKLPVEVEITSAERKGRDLHLVLLVSVPMSELTMLPGAGGTKDAAFSVWVTSGRELGDAAAVARQETRFTFPADASPAGEKVRYSFELIVRRGTNRVSIGFRDETSKDVGLATIEVPRV